ncbi:MAG TPA: cytochrome c [Flavilitoribacter sp.]|nr:cytochrome c [Flavilitoribacter sp.]HMQ88794.1 cytochrome c [Flavilitoribacter sp.]
MKHLLVTVLVAALVVACGSESPDQSSGNASTAEKAAAPAVDGEKVYKQYCIACHGLYGDMGASGAFNLQVSALTADERVKVITEGRNAMVSFKTLLNEDQIKAVAAYTMTLKKEGE